MCASSGIMYFFKPSFSLLVHLLFHVIRFIMPHFHESKDLINIVSWDHFQIWYEYGRHSLKTKPVFTLFSLYRIKYENEEAPYPVKSLEFYLGGLAASLKREKGHTHIHTHTLTTMCSIKFEWMIDWDYSCEYVIVRIFQSDFLNLALVAILET